MRMLKKHCRNAEKELAELGERLCLVRLRLDGSGSYVVPLDVRQMSREELIAEDARLMTRIEVASAPVWVDVASSKFRAWRELADIRPRVLRGPEAGLLPRLHRLVVDGATAQIARTLLEELGPEVKRRRATTRPVWTTVEHLDAETFGLIARWASKPSRSIQSYLKSSSWAAFVEHVIAEEAALDMLGKRNWPVIGRCAGREFRAVSARAFPALAKRFRNCARAEGYTRSANRGAALMLCSYVRGSELPVGMYWVCRQYGETSKWVLHELRASEIRVREQNTIHDKNAPDTAKITRWLNRASTRRKLVGCLPSPQDAEHWVTTEPPGRHAEAYSLQHPSDSLLTDIRHICRHPLTDRDVRECRHVQKVLRGVGDELTAAGAAILDLVTWTLETRRAEQRAHERWLLLNESLQSDCNEAWEITAARCKP